ncbi:MAG: magnesium/cobalt efflux protein [Gammaproteobacteria bacterium]|uniref:HlyC/CorC family transporter n=1 Tax=OM182 bacterium TaxID=2510334 RepID=A0A520S1K3_9GAMM|nr:magnesium/cobalt efflux protein [Gammaproteobacteria bacterium]RZO76348.1 MAG: HlyC/CorC family transporter [OM182 bacterium]
MLSAYFSGSETAMMRVNRFRLKHLANEGHRGARKASRLLKRPDRLLSLILIGNNFVNFTAASIATLLVIDLFGEANVAWAPVICTIIFLIFAEVAPKTIAEAYPEKISLMSAYILQPLMAICWILVEPVIRLSNSLLRIAGVPERESEDTDNLTHEELRTVVNEGVTIAERPQGMMLGVLDLNKVTVNDIMVARIDIEGIDLTDDIESILNQIRATQHTRVPVFNEDIDKVIGVLHLRNAARFLTAENPTKASIVQETDEPYFVPENTPLHTQLVNFQQTKQRIGLVVDEYGDIEGIVTMEDILEEIVGEFTTDIAETGVNIHPEADNTFLIDGGTHIRLINRSLGWKLPQEGPKTLSGLIIEELEIIPDSSCCIALNDYHIEVIQIQDNMIKTARINQTETEIIEE